MLNFAVGPVMMSENIRSIGYEQIPYFRTPAFSRIVLESEQYLKEDMGAPEDARVILMTGSGTASMEAVVMNTLTAKDRAIVVDGGSFGRRFCEICGIHGIPYTPIVCERGRTLTEEQLAPFEGAGYTAFLVNLGETSTGVLYDLDMIAAFCRRNGLFLIVDAISAFLCDPLSMERQGVNVVVTGSQKALAVAPGLSVICCDAEAIRRIENVEVQSLYFDLKAYLKDGERGQTPFTPAVGVILQLHARLQEIHEHGGVGAELAAAAAKAAYCRSRIGAYPFRLFADKPSNAVTALEMADPDKSAYRIFEVLKDEYDIFVCPNGGELRDRVLRIGHMGALTEADYDTLFAALHDLSERGIL